MNWQHRSDGRVYSEQPYPGHMYTHGESTFLILYRGETKRDKDWACDEWSCQISTKNGEHVFSYFTGLGHRKKIAKPYNTERVVTPNYLDIMSCLLWDAEGAKESFKYWCVNYGYDDDSIKALNIYKKCEETLEAMHKLFTKAELDEFRELTKDL